MRYFGCMAAIAALLLITGRAADGHSGQSMILAANAFLAELSSEQRAKAFLDFQSMDRFEWNFVPLVRKGIPLKELNEKQRRLAQDFLRTGLSVTGYTKAATIMELEMVLRELEGNMNRDPDLYYFAIFGAPSTNAAWGWRVEGHHLSLNFTVVNGTMVATTPEFLGSNPAEVRQGSRMGLRVLRAEEDIARELVNSLSDPQRSITIFQAQAFPDIVTRNSKLVDPLSPVGISASQLNKSQMELLMRLLDEYASTMAPDLGAERIEKLRRAGLEKIRFGWAGSTSRGQPHYYRVQGPTFLIEYDNTQNNANHIHSVWRDFDGDFGRDLLREHYRDSPHHHSN